jgi:hypothetical protein
VAALQGGRLVVSQPEECAIFIFHTTQDTTRRVYLLHVHVSADANRTLDDTDPDS